MSKIVEFLQPTWEIWLYSQLLAQSHLCGNLVSKSAKEAMLAHSFALCMYVHASASPQEQNTFLKGRIEL